MTQEEPYTSLSVLNILLDFGDKAPLSVGKLAYKDRAIYFEYHADFLEAHLDISPFMLPLKQGVMSGNPALFDGLPGVFNDSLPDGWGRLLLARLLDLQTLPTTVHMRHLHYNHA